MADQLCTTAQVKTRLFPAGTSDASDDTLISELIDQVSGWIELYTGRKLLAVNSTTKTFDTSYGYVLRVPMGIRSISALGVATSHQPDSGGTYTSVSAADYLLRPKVDDLPVGWPYMDLRISRAATGAIPHFYDAENGCQITGTFGFATTPPEIQAVTIDAVTAAYASRKAGTSGVIGSENGVIFPWANYFTSNSPQRQTLNAYRHIGLA